MELPPERFHVVFAAVNSERLPVRSDEQRRDKRHLHESSSNNAKQTCRRSRRQPDHPDGLSQHSVLQPRQRSYPIVALTVMPCVSASNSLALITT